jgi:hypothetical protein
LEKIKKREKLKKKNQEDNLANKLFYIEKNHEKFNTVAKRRA